MHDMPTPASMLNEWKVYRGAGCNVPIGKQSRTQKQAKHGVHKTSPTSAVMDTITHCDKSVPSSASEVGEKKNNAHHAQTT